MGLIDSFTYVPFVNGNDRRIVGLLMPSHAMVHTYEMSLPLLIAVWLVEFDVSTATIGLIVAAGYAVFGLGALPGGVLSDTFGSRRLVGFCLAGMAGSFLLLSQAPGIAVVTLSLLLWGVTASVYHPAGLSLISTGVTRRGGAFAYHGMAGNVGLALGPFVVILLLLVFDWRTVVALMAIPGVLLAIATVSVDLDETAAVAPTTRETDDAAAGEPGEKVTVEGLQAIVVDTRTLFAGGFLAVFAIVMLYGLYYRGTLTFLPELLRDFQLFSPVEFGVYTLETSDLFYVFVLVVGVLGQYVAGLFTARFPTEYGITGTFIALIVLGLVFVPASGAGMVPLLLVGTALGFFLFAVQPFYQALVAEYTPPGTRGLSYGYTYMGQFGVGAIGGAIAGVLLDHLSVSVLFVVLAAFAVGGAAVGLFVSGVGRGRSASTVG